MPAQTVQISAEFTGLDASLSKSLDKVLRGQGLKIPLDTKSITDFSYQLDRATQRVITLGTAFGVLATANRAIREMVSSTVQVEKSLTSVNAIFKLTNDNLNRFSASLFDISRDTATSFNEVAKAATEFSRQGLSVVETQKAVRAALLLSRDAGIDVEESVKALTSATNSFNKEALSRLQIANRLASVDAAFAVSSKDLAEALVRTGSAAADAGVSFNQFIGLVTAAQQISQRGGTAIAGALNTIFTRVNRKDTLDALDSLGVAITDVRGEALPTIQVLQNFAVAYDKMTGSIRNQAAELVGGVRQLNTLKATLKDLATEGSVFAQVQEVIARNSNELERRNAARNQTLAAQGSQIATSAQQIGSNIGNVGIAGSAKQVLGAVLNNPITQALEAANGSAETAGGKVAETFIRGFGSALVFGVGPILLKVLQSVTSQVVGNLLKDVQAITGLNAEEKQRAAIEAEIVALYKAGGVALQEQLASMSTLAERAAYVRNILGGVGSSYGNVGQIAGEIQALGGLPRRPRAAEGFLPFAAEGAAIAAGVGGAPATAHPVYLPGFNRGDGLGIVANTSEFVVPGAAGGAIYNRDMIQRYGLPPGSTPVAAGGYMPHAAGGDLSPEYSQRSYYQNLSFGGSPPPPPPPPIPSSSVSASQLAADYDRALKEVVRSSKEQAKLAKQKELEMEQILRDSTDERKAGKVLSATTQKAMALAEQRVRDYQEEQSLLREQLTAEFTLQKALKASAASAAASLRPKKFTNGDYAIIPQGDEVPVLSTAAEAAHLRRIGYSRLVQQGKIGRLTDEQVEAEIAAGRDLGFDPIGRKTAGKSPQLAEAELAATSLTASEASEKDLPTRRSLYSRLSKTAGSLRGSLALGIGLPFLAGLLPDGESGTVGGQALGAAKNAGQLAGTGATVGSFFGPEGTLIGAGIGAAIGGLTGWISKASKSFEELSADLDQRNKKLGEDLNNALEVFRIQDNLKEALLSGNTQQIRDLQEERKTQLAKVKDPRYLDILNNRLNDPSARFDLAKLGNNGLLSNSLQAQLTASFAPANTNLESFFGIQGGLTTGKEDTAARDAIANVIGGLSPKELSDLRRKTLRSPDSALSQIAGLAGFKGDERDQFLGQSRNSGFVTSSILEAIKYVSLSAGKGGNFEKQDADFAAKSKQLINLAAQYRTNADLSNISDVGSKQISQSRSQIILNSPELTDVDRLNAQRNIQLQEISSTASSQRSTELKLGKGDLLEILGKQKETVAQSSIDFIEQLQSLSGLKDFRTTLGTTAGKTQFQNVNTTTFDVALNNLIRSLEKNEATEEENIQVTKITNDLLQHQLENSRNFSGGIEDTVGGNAKAAINLSAAINRNDPESTVRSATLAKKLADIEAVRRFRPFGLGDEQANTETLSAQQQFSLESRQSAFRASQGQGSDVRVNLGIQSADLTLQESIQTTQDALKIAVRRGDEESSINQLKVQLQDLILENRLRNTDSSSEGGTRLERLQNRAAIARNGRFTTSGDASATAFAVAKEQGLQGNALGSFSGGFGSVFAGAKKDLNDFSDVGKQVADSFQNNFAQAFGSFVTGAQKGKDAFKSLITAVLAESARAFASKAVVSLLGTLFNSFGGTGTGTGISASIGAGGPEGDLATGGFVGRASGGSIPTMLTGGEFVYPPAAASRIGGRMLNAVNTGTMRGFAPGGLVRGGSGVRDDVFQPLAAGSFVVRKAMVERYGADNLAHLSIGGVPEGVTTPMHAITSGGPMLSMMSTPAPTTVVSGGGGGTFNIGVHITNNTTTSNSSSSSQPGSPLADRQLGETLTRRIRQVTLQTIQEQQRIGGVLRPQSIAAI